MSAFMFYNNANRLIQMKIERRVNEWWFDPVVKTPRYTTPARYKNVDPLSYRLPPNKRVVGSFNPSRKWVPYTRLHPIDAGYIVELYTLNDIAHRYGLSHASKRYYRSNILPEPFDIVRRRSVSAHHWSRFTLMVLDTVLLDLQKKGFLQFTKKFNDHVELLHTGVSYLEDYYSRKTHNEDLTNYDSMGVQWLDR